MIAIFDRNSNLVGWFDGGNFFDDQLNWVAFLASRNIFSTKNVDWLGPLNAGSLLDKQGKPVAWLANSQPQGTLLPLKPLRPLKPLTPLKPLRPLTPLKPLTPLTPLGGWSLLNFRQWLVQ